MRLWHQVITFVAATSFCLYETIGNCTPGEARCADARCVRACDGALDCADGADEALALCRGTQRPLLGLMMLCLQPWSPVLELVCPEACRHLPQACYYAIGAEHGSPGTCVLPPWPHGGSYNIVDITPQRQGPADFSLQFSCQPEYGLKGVQPRCVKGNWTTDFPSCQPPNTCQLPPYPAHGSYVVADAPAARPGQFRPALYLTVACDSGFEVLGDRVGTCVFGAWLKSVPQCTPMKDCIQDGVRGSCTRLGQCAPLLSNPNSQWWRLNICGYEGIEPIICCTETSSVPRTTPPSAVPAPPEEDYHDESPAEAAQCPALPPGLTLNRTGAAAWDNAIKYQQELLYPCVRSASLTGGYARENHCLHSTDEEHALGVVDALPNEFPHMVLLGYGQRNGTAVWQCGGTLLSDRFILTAAHCLRSGHTGLVTYAIVGTLKRTDNVSSSEVYRIKNLYAHPMYRPPAREHDIALIETDPPVKLGRSVVPACLDVFGGNKTRAVATGWGATVMFGAMSDTLHKVTLTRFPDAECRAHYPPRRLNQAGFNASTQFCYGSYERAADTCQGDSGGPLTVKNDRLHCMYTVVGVTSYGKTCGQPGIPSIYTKVEHYVPWIENIIWG